jgi:excisionase family DNA binding protein
VEVIEVEQRLMTAPEIADKFEVSTARVYELARTGLLPGVVRIGRQVRFNPEAIKSFIENGGQPLPGGWKR